MNKVEKIKAEIERTISQIMELESTYSNKEKGQIYNHRRNQYQEKINSYKYKLNDLGKGLLAKVDISVPFTATPVNGVSTVKTFYLVNLDQKEIEELVSIHYNKNLGYRIQFLETGFRKT